MEGSPHFIFINGFRIADVWNKDAKQRDWNWGLFTEV